MNTIYKFQTEIDNIRKNGLYKTERIIESPQAAQIRVANKEVLNFCANNYLGLSNNTTLKRAAKKALDEFGFGLSSVRFICGTQTIHKKLEEKLSDFLRMEDTILYTSCFDANTGFFEALFNEEDAIVSDKLNHASIIDGVRLCRAMRFAYRHSDMEHLESILIEARKKEAKNIVIVTDGVFSMDGDVAKLNQIRILADRYKAMMMVDDSHATGFFGPTGRGSIEHCGLLGEVDIVTSTLGKALGGATGGFTSGKRQVVELLRQRSRPYLFSNSIPPAIVASAIAGIDLLCSNSKLRTKLNRNTRYFRKEITKLGFNVKVSEHPIIPIMLYDARLAARFADDLLEEGIYVIGFSYPVVPQGEARIRLQLSTAHTIQNLDQALRAFEKVGKMHSVI